MFTSATRPGLLQLRWVAIAALCCAGASRANPEADIQALTFGKRTVHVPPPAGFVALSAREPGVLVQAQAYLPQSNRLVEMYQPESGEIIDSTGFRTAYFQLQSLRHMDGVTISTAEFDRLSVETEKELEQAFVKLDELAETMMSKGNDSVQSQTGTDPAIALNGTVYLGRDRKEPWGLFFSLRSTLSAGEGSAASSAQMAMSGAIVIIDQQQMMLYAYRRFNGPNDQAWTRDAVSRWADQVRAANPDRLVLKTDARANGWDWRRTAFMGIAGALVAGLIAVVVQLGRRNS